MGTYIGSPWGFILGKIGDTVGGKWRGINWNRVRVLPTQRGTLDMYRKLKDGLISPETFSYKQMNIRRVALQVLGHVGRMNLASLIYPVWAALVIKRAWVMTGINAFVRRNAANLYNSMTDRDAEYTIDTNDVDLCEILMSDGDLEGPAGITTCTYDELTGDLAMVWDPGIFTNGADDDESFIVVLKRDTDGGVMESVGRYGTWFPNLYMYGSAIPVPLPGVPVIRSDGTRTIVLPIGLAATELTAFLFFRDKESIIGYSPSVCCEVTAP